jgi:hypothetical protein
MKRASRPSVPGALEASLRGPSQPSLSMCCGHKCWTPKRTKLSRPPISGAGFERFPERERFTLPTNGRCASQENTAWGDA